MVNESFGKGGDGLALMSAIEHQDDGQPHILRQIGGGAIAALGAVKQSHDALDNHEFRIMVNFG